MESTHPHRENAVHPAPVAEYDLTDNVVNYENNFEVWPQLLPHNIEFPVEVENGYIIGFVHSQRLYPFIDHEAGGIHDWTKIRIDGMVNEPIFPTDPLTHQFFNCFPRPREKIHFAIRY